eukprot:TRINITY_DN11940_c0_g1::TRINITY_DN11940_c0_g1_i1::g.16972::m.16972 TRINITY_DN11940_c0_g1::TRINITY_DN11940_c0_g1_i1::g.16972  ORF type:complete len:355 (-),score=-9.92,Cyclin_N/PF00134.18/2e-05 TRINITY_DN11940_c0_g1_i1:672-1736(-)
MKLGSWNRIKTMFRKRSCSLEVAPKCVSMSLYDSVIASPELCAFFMSEYMERMCALPCASQRTAPPRGIKPENPRSLPLEKWIIYLIGKTSTTIGLCALVYLRRVFIPDMASLSKVDISSRLSEDNVHQAIFTSIILAQKCTSDAPRNPVFWENVCHRIWSSEQILGMEKSMLRALNWYTTIESSLFSDLVVLANKFCRLHKQGFLPSTFYRAHSSPHTFDTSSLHMSNLVVPMGCSPSRFRRNTSHGTAYSDPESTKSSFSATTQNFSRTTKLLPLLRDSDFGSLRSISMSSTQMFISEVATPRDASLQRPTLRRTRSLPDIITYTGVLSSADSYKLKFRRTHAHWFNRSITL